MESEAPKTIWESSAFPTWGCLVVSAVALILAIVWRIHDKSGTIFSPSSWNGLAVFGPATFVACLMIVAAIINYKAHQQKQAPMWLGKTKGQRLQWCNSEPERDWRAWFGGFRRNWELPQQVTEETRQSIAYQNKLIELGRSIDSVLSPFQIEILTLTKQFQNEFNEYLKANPEPRKPSALTPDK
jgi:hypothetical protein